MAQMTEWVTCMIQTILPKDENVIQDGQVGCALEVSSDDFRYLSVGLPPEIARLKAAGYLDRAIESCNRLLMQDPPHALAACLRAERYRMQELPKQFCVSRNAAIATIQREWPSFTEADFERLIRHKRIDWRFINGELHVLDNFLDSLRVYPKEVPGLTPEPIRDNTTRDRMLAAMRSDGGACCEITLASAISIPGARTGEVVSAWLPLASSCYQQSDIEILEASPRAFVAPDVAPARTVHWESDTERDFSITYRYRATVPYTDIYAGEFPRYPDRSTPVPSDTAPMPPHIVFTPYLQGLTACIVKDCTDDLDRARVIYDYITKNVDYRYQPAYVQLDSIANDCMQSLRGDCGVMTLAFIAMCRIAGIPARWESGLYVAPDHVGPHDWARFYTSQTGWLWADCSFGSSARRLGEEARRRHYFGNLDPWRMVANRAFEADFTPLDSGVREDPYDNQMGEANVDGRGCREYEMRRCVSLIKMIDIPFREKTAKPVVH